MNLGDKLFNYILQHILIVVCWLVIELKDRLVLIGV